MIAHHPRQEDEQESIRCIFHNPHAKLSSVYKVYRMISQFPTFLLLTLFREGEHQLTEKHAEEPYIITLVLTRLRHYSEIRISSASSVPVSRMSSLKARINNSLRVYEPTSLVAATVVSVAALWAGIKILKDPRGTLSTLFRVHVS